MPKKGDAGFTLLELLIVLVILAILGVAAFANFRTLSEDQILKKATGDIQSFLRLAQANATTGLLCNGTGGATWSVRFSSDQKKLEMYCDKTATRQRELILEEAEVYRIEFSPTLKDCPSASSVSLPMTVCFSPLYGNVSFVEGTDCSAASSTTTIKVSLLNKKTNSTYQCFNMTKGGAVDTN